MKPPEAPAYSKRSRCSADSSLRLGPAGRYLDIGVEQYVIAAADLPQGAVVTLGEAIVAVETDDAHGGVGALHPLDGVVRRAVVCHDDIRFGRRAFDHAAQETAQMRDAVPVEYYYAQ